MRVYLLFILLLIQSSEVDAQTIQYKYDKAGRLLREQYANKTTTAYTWDNDGNRTGQQNTVCTVPTANFSASKTTGPCPLVVDFYDNSLITGSASYHWTFYKDSVGTIDTSILQNPTGITYTTSGTYMVKLHITDVCDTNTKAVINYITVVCPPTVISEKLRSGTIQVYPNPTEGMVCIQGKGIENGTYTIQVRNLIGELLQEKEMHVSTATLDGIVNLASYASGIYVITVTSGQSIVTFRVERK